MVRGSSCTREQTTQIDPRGSLTLFMVAYAVPSRLTQPSPRLSSMPTPGAGVLVLDGESLTAEGLMRIHADASPTGNFTECVLSDKAWENIKAGRDVIDRAIASGKV